MTTTTWKAEAAYMHGQIDALQQFAQCLLDELVLSTWQRQRIPALASERCAEIMHRLRVPSSGSSTSKKAARASSITAGSLRARVLTAHLSSSEGMTDEEVGNAIGHARIWPRCSELRSLGLLRATEATRKCDRTGQETRVYQLTDSGRRLAQKLS
jgi:hypothetical protein